MESKIYKAFYRAAIHFDSCADPDSFYTQSSQSYDSCSAVDFVHVVYLTDMSCRPFAFEILLVFESLE